MFDIADKTHCSRFQSLKFNLSQLFIYLCCFYPKRLRKTPTILHTNKKMTEKSVFRETKIKIVKHPLKCYFKHIFIILVASKRQTYSFKSSLHVYLFRNRVNRMHPKCPEMTSQSFPVSCFRYRGFVPHRK